MYYVETHEELNDSVRQFSQWLQCSNVVEDMGYEMFLKIQVFALKSIHPYKAHWARHIVMDKITLQTNTTSGSEAMHSALKTGYLSTNPQQDLDESARCQIAKSNRQLLNRKTVNESALNGTALWIKGSTNDCLTIYAGNLNANMLDRREKYGVVQG